MLKMRHLGGHQVQKAPRKAIGKTGLKSAEKERLGEETVRATLRPENACWGALLSLSSLWGLAASCTMVPAAWHLTGTGRQIMRSDVQGQSDSAKREISFFQLTHFGLKEQFLSSETTCHSLKQFTCYSGSGHFFKEQGHPYLTRPGIWVQWEAQGTEARFAVFSACIWGLNSTGSCVSKADVAFPLHRAIGNQEIGFTC